MTEKAELVAYLASMPDSITREELLYETYLFASVRSGLDDLSAGRILTHEDVKAKIAEWSSGQHQP